MKRLVRLITIAAVTAAVVAAIRALRSQQDPLPAPAAPGGEPWPPLRNESAAPAEPSAPAAREDESAPQPVAPPTEAPAVVPEPGGVPVAGSPYADPTADGECPDGYPIKAKLSSKIFHSPGQLNYDRTTPDRCYASAEAAEADGLRAAKR